PQDELVAGPSGIGYMYPSDWPTAHLPVFLEHTGQAMRQMDLTTLEVLDSNFLRDIPLMLRALFKGSGMALIDRNLQRTFVAALSPFGLGGILSGAGQNSASWIIISGVPVYQSLGIAESVDELLSLLRHASAAQVHRPSFLHVYILAWKMTPSSITQAVQQLGSEYEVVTPGTLLAMLAEAKKASESASS
ncbi:MAG: hypothetical protein M3Z24_02045, partial [Chloroflexota bacterium]|nr:hypothetical protein [Chloroflexota bacterium]